MKKEKLIDPIEMGRRLKGLRDQLAVKRNIDATQYLLADSVQLHRTAYNAAENGRGAMSKEALCRIVEFYRGYGINASLDWIILGIEPDLPPETDKDKEISQLKDQLNLLTQTLEALNSLILKKGRDDKEN